MTPGPELQDCPWIICNDPFDGELSTGVVALLCCRRGELTPIGSSDSLVATVLTAFRPDRIKYAWIWEALKSHGRETIRGQSSMSFRSLSHGISSLVAHQCRPAVQQRGHRKIGPRGCPIRGRERGSGCYRALPVRRLGR